MTTIIEQLQQLGFSQYEAQAYIALLKSSPLNGYELAKASGIPRPNIYPVLQKLEERGAILRLDLPDGTRYSPVNPDELLSRLQQRYQTALEGLSGALKDISAPPALESILNLRSYPILLDHARALLAGARHRLLFSGWPEESLVLSDSLQQAANRGVQITTLCLRGCPTPCSACQGVLFRYPIAEVNGGRWLVIVSDDQEMLAGEITAQEQTLAVRTRQKMLVNLTAGYISTSLALATILSNLGEKLDAQLDPRQLAALNSLQAQGEFLSAMRQLIQLK